MSFFTFFSIFDQVLFLFYAQIKQKSQITAESPDPSDTVQSVHRQAVSMIMIIDFRCSV